VLAPKMGDRAALGPGDAAPKAMRGVDGTREKLNRCGVDAACREDPGKVPCCEEPTGNLKLQRDATGDLSAVPLDAVLQAPGGGVAPRHAVTMGLRGLNGEAVEIRTGEMSL